SKRGALLLELGIALRLGSGPPIQEAASVCLLELCGCFVAAALPWLSFVGRLPDRIAVRTEVGEKQGGGDRAHALLAPRIHCFRMAAACSSSKSIICSSRFCGVRPSLLVRSAIRLGDCSFT